MTKHSRVLQAVIACCYLSAVLGANLRSAARRLDAEENEGTSGPKHVLLIVTDDQGYSDIGYQDPTFYTPTLDRLAAEGIKLRNMHVSSTCTPTRAALMTGMYANKLGLQDGAMVVGEERRVPYSVDMLPVFLRTQNYKNYMVGKWHLGQAKMADLPMQRGFDRFFGMLNGGAGYFDRKTGLGCNAANPISPDGLPPAYGNRCFFINGFDLIEGNEPSTKYNPATGGSNEYLTDIFKAKAVQYIDEHDPSQPMFLYLAPTGPHSPLDVTQKYLDLCPNVVPSPGSLHSDFRQKVCGMMAAVDNMTASVIDKLAEKNMLQDTLILYTSDNGGVTRFGSVNGVFRGGKGDVFEGGIRVPAFVTGAPVAAAAAACNHERDDLVHAVDFFSTIASYAGVYIPEYVPVDGLSFWHSILRSTPFRRRSVQLDIASQFLGYTGGVKFKHGNAIYKYTVDPGRISYAGSLGPLVLGEFLFNLDNDPSETTNLIPSSATESDGVQFWTQFPTFLDATAYWKGRLIYDQVKEDSAPTQLVSFPPPLTLTPSPLGCWIPSDFANFTTVNCGIKWVPVPVRQ